MAEPDYILDLSSQQVPRNLPRNPKEGSKGHSGETSEDNSGGGGEGMRGRPWIAVHWKCCQTYSRIYRNAAGTAYDGRCPKCGSPVHAAVGQDGTATRFFEAQ